MTNDLTTWLLQEVSDLLDAGTVGLYEFIWLLRGADAELSEDELRAHASVALDRLRQAGAGRLVWLRWPSEEAVAGADALIPDSDDWADPVEGKPYLAFGRL